MNNHGKAIYKIVPTGTGSIYRAASGSMDIEAGTNGANNSWEKIADRVFFDETPSNSQIETMRITSYSATLNLIVDDNTNG